MGQKGSTKARSEEVQRGMKRVCKLPTGRRVQNGRSEVEDAEKRDVQCGPREQLRLRGDSLEMKGKTNNV
jgi:hypothetical protein